MLLYFHYEAGGAEVGVRLTEDVNEGLIVLVLPQGALSDTTAIGEGEIVCITYDNE